MPNIIYHGSDHIIHKPVYGGGKPYNDYGYGFYCTEDPDMAKEWSVSRDRNGFANSYSLDCRGLKILDLTDPEFSLLNWLAVLLENREFEISSALSEQAKRYLMYTFRVDYKSCDCMIGYRADDSSFSFAQDFISGTISYQQLCRAMHLGEPGLEFVLKSKRAFDRIRFEGYETAESSVWFPKKYERDRSARMAYFDSVYNRSESDDIYITQILSEEMNPDDPRLR